jgi:hypothetical protein
MYDMESLDLGEVAAVSPYWTEKHIDVTHAPLAYAKPKSSFLEGLDSYRPLVRIDSRDRQARRAMNTLARTTAIEIRALPPVAVLAAEPETIVLARPSLVQSVKGLLRRRAQTVG